MWGHTWGVAPGFILYAPTARIAYTELCTACTRLRVAYMGLSAACTVLTLAPNIPLGGLRGYVLAPPGTSKATTRKKPAQKQSLGEMPWAGPKHSS